MHPSESADAQRYQVFLLRLWRNRTDTPWRVSLQSVDDQRPFQFQSLAHCMDFLETLTETSALSQAEVSVDPSSATKDSE